MFEEISTKKLSFGEILSLGWKIYKLKIKTIIAIMLLTGLPALLAQFTFPAGSIGGASPVIYFILTIIGFCTSMLGALAVSYVVEAAVNGQEISYREAFERGFTRWGVSIWTSILCGLIVIGLSFLLIIPGIIWSVYYIFALYIVALKGLSGKEALDYRVSCKMNCRNIRK